MKYLWALFGLVALSAGFVIKEAKPLHFDGEVEWQAWKVFHGKKYATEAEERARFAIWADNMQKISKHNSENHKHTLAMNHFGDLTSDEYRYLYLGVKSHYSNYTKRTGSTFLPPSNVQLPEQVDWRTKGYVTPVKNQGQCGSCWAFSSTGALEGQHFRKTGQLVSLSEQNLVDCSASYGNHGCQGGLMDNAFRYIENNGGIDTEASYPYDAANEYCRYSASSIGATCTGYTDIQQGSESDLQAASATVGPISVAIDAGHMSFQFYSGGVYDEPSCSSTKLDHGVLVVGYGTYGGQDYWLVKNSWGPRWGLEGYVMMSRNKNNQCGVATLASYPRV